MSYLSVSLVLMKGFKEFIMRPTLVDVAVAFVMGKALSDLVGSLVKNLVMPGVGIVGGAPNFDSYMTTINGSQITWGTFLTALATFIFVGFGVYMFIVKPFQMYEERKPKEPEEEAVDEQLVLLREIRDNLKK